MRLFLILFVLVAAFPVQCQWYYPGYYPGGMYPGMGWGYRPWGWGYRPWGWGGGWGGGWGYRRSKYQCFSLHLTSSI
ncbi:hypothetical protein Aduo_015608 [Ancylostoma duodenale]